MADRRSRPAVYTIPVGAPFLDTLAEALLDGRLIGEIDRSNPLALAGATVFLPTRRAVRAFREALFARLGGQAGILPAIRPLGDIDEDEHLLAADPESGALELLPEAISPLQRRLALSRLTLAWGRTVRRELLALEEGESLSVPASAADATRLAGDLARLIDDMETAGLPWRLLEGLTPEDHAHYFQITLDFLKIVSEAWPAHLERIGRADPAARRDRLIRDEARRIADDPRPVIAAGSTGSIPATAELLKAIAHAPAGAVVLPGLDRELDAAGWAAVDDVETAGAAAFTHPQFGMKRLIGEVGVTRDDVATLLPAAHEAAGARARATLLSHAMRPSATSDAWARRDVVDPATAMVGIDLVMARTEQEEAAAIAIAMRELVEHPTRTAALVTPDRALARRVVAELRRWNLDVDDSAGSRLDREPAGVFCRLVADCLSPVAPPDALLNLLKHPAAAFSMGPAEARRAAEALELAILRGERPVRDLADLEQAVARARQTVARGEEGEARPRRIPEARRRLSPRDWDRAADLAARVVACLADAAAIFAGDDVSAADAAAAMAAVLRAVSAADDQTDGDIWRTGDGDALAGLLEALMETGGDAVHMRMPAHEVPAFLTALMAEIAVPREPGADPRLHIWGTLEARLQSVDLVILAGLDEGVLPAAPDTDPFLSRAMRTAIGLAPPERRLGLAAHDVVQAMAAPQVICTRAEKRGGAPTVESRWLQRLRAVAGGDAMTAAEQRGERWLHLARAIDRPRRDDAKSVARPCPTPPLEARPDKLRVTEIETLIRDPYAIYAKRVLGLEPLEPVGAPPDRALRGTLYHDALGAFTEGWRGDYGPAAEARLMTIAREVLEDVATTPEVHAIWSARFAAIAGWLVAWESSRDAEVAERHAEIDGDLAVPVASGQVNLRGRADRIDLMADGTVAIYDYKTGTPPSERQVFAGLTPQMTLEAAMVRAGAFGDAFRGRSVSSLDFIALGQVGRGEPLTGAVPRGESADELADRAHALLRGLLGAFGRIEHGYLSRARPILERARFRGDYDHLARVQEWSLQEAEEDYQ